MTPGILTAGREAIQRQVLQQRGLLKVPAVACGLTGGLHQQPLA